MPEPPEVHSRRDEWPQLVDILCDTTTRHVPVVQPQTAMLHLIADREAWRMQTVQMQAGMSAIES